MRTVLLSVTFGFLSIVNILPVHGATQFDGKHFPWPRLATPGDVMHFNRPTREVETPHLKAAVPYTDGRTRVLFITARPHVRPLIEVCQRFDIDERYALIFDNRKLDNTGDQSRVIYAPGAEKEPVLKALAAGLAWKPDVICLLYVPWGKLPGEVREEIIKQVKAGAGLVGWQIGSSEDAGFLEGVFGAGATDAKATNSLLTSVPEEMGYRFSGTQARTIGPAGRAVQLYHRGVEKKNAKEKGTEELFSYMHDEDLYSFIGRAFLWAAGREPRTTMNVAVDQDSCRVKLQGAKVEKPSITIDIYDPTAVLRHEREYTAEIPLDADVKMPHLKTGPHWVRLTLRSGGKVVDWQTRIVEAKTPVSIEAIKFTKEHLEPNETVEATVTLSGNSLEDYTLEYFLQDTHDRVIHRGKAAAANKVKVSGPVRDCMSAVCFLVARVKANGKIMAEHREWFTVARTPVDTEDFHGIVWANGAGSGYIPSSIYLHCVTLWQASIGLEFEVANPFVPPYEEWPKSISNVRPYMYAINYGMNPTLKENRGGPTRQPCLTSRGYDRGCVAKLQRCVKASQRFSPMAYSNCGDTRLGKSWDICFSDTCIADFQKYLKKRHKSLAELNANWDSNFGNWSEVTPIVLKSLEAWKKGPDKTGKTAPLPPPGQYARWIEHRLHMELVYANRHARDRVAVKQVDPEAKYGIDSLAQQTDSKAGFNYVELLKSCQFYGPYMNPFKYEMGRCFASKDSLKGSWVAGGYGNYRTENCSRHAPWQLLFDCFNVQMFFEAYGQSGVGMNYSFIAPDLRPYPGMAYGAEELKELQAGTAKLLLSAKRENDGIAFLYSPASVHAATVTRGMPKPDFAAVEGVPGHAGVHTMDSLEFLGANEAMSYLFRDLGFQYDYVSPAQVVEGKLLDENFRLLVLPYSQAFSPEIAEAIRKFVAAGGVVLADFRPGIFDGHGRLLGKGQLDDLFGIKRPAGFPAKLKTRLVKSETKIADLPVDHQVKVTQAKALADAEGASAFILRKLEKGRAILLNFFPLAYTALRTKGTEMPLRDTVESILADAGIKPRVRLTAEDGNVPCTQAVRFTHGDNEYVGVLRDYRLRIDEAVPLFDLRPRWTTIDFGRTGYVYDTRKGLYIDKTDKIQTMVAPARALLYAVLPYAVDRVDVTEQGSTDPREKNFAVSVVPSKGSPGTHVFRVTLIDPSGRERKMYAQNVKADDGTASVRILMAFSDPSGFWRLKARDTASGHVGQAKFEYQAP